MSSTSPEQTPREVSDRPIRISSPDENASSPAADLHEPSSVTEDTPFEINGPANIKPSPNIPLQFFAKPSTGQTVKLSAKMTVTRIEQLEQLLGLTLKHLQRGHLELEIQSALIPSIKNIGAVKKTQTLLIPDQDTMIANMKSNVKLKRSNKITGFASLTANEMVYAGEVLGIDLRDQAFNHAVVKMKTAYTELSAAGRVPEPLEAIFKAGKMENWWKDNADKKGLAAKAKMSKNGRKKAARSLARGATTTAPNQAAPDTETEVDDEEGGVTLPIAQHAAMEVAQGGGGATLPTAKHRHQTPLEKAAQSMNSKATSVTRSETHRPATTTEESPADFGSQLHSQSEDEAAQEGPSYQNLGRGRKSLRIKDWDALPEIAPDNRGRVMLEKMGWSAGTGLGSAKNQGRLYPVAPKIPPWRDEKPGLG